MMADAIADRSFLVTGCASGIGMGLATALARRGARVLATDIDTKRLNDAAREHRWPSERVVCRQLDVRDVDHWRNAVTDVGARFGRLDVAMNVAGYARAGYLLDLDPSEIDRHLEVNARGVMLGTKIAAEAMIKTGGGHIVNISSLASVAPTPGIALYTASKFAIRGFSLAVAQELRPLGVHVTLVGPDVVDTPMIAPQLELEESAYSFSGSRILGVDEVVNTIVGRVLKRRPLEVLLPASRGWLCKAVNTFPQVAGPLAPILRRRGLARQARERARRDAD